jgi:hypothetical protein
MLDVLTRSRAPIGRSAIWFLPRIRAGLAGDDGDETVSWARTGGPYEFSARLFAAWEHFRDGTNPDGDDSVL